MPEPTFEAPLGIPSIGRHGASPSASDPLLGVVAEIATLLTADAPLAFRLTRAVARISDATGGGACTLELTDGSGVRGPIRLEGRAGSRIEAPLTDGSRGLGTLVLEVPADPGDERAVVGIAAELIAAALRAERRVRSAMEALERSLDEREVQRAFLARLVDSLPVGLYVVDREYRVQAWNRNRETGLQGVARASAIGRPIFEVLHRQPSAKLREEFDAVFATGESQQYELETGSGSDRRWYRVTKLPMRLDGDDEVSHVISIGEDLTERRRAQQSAAQAEKLAAVGQLSAGVMHEVNNPLAIIGACAESAAGRLQHPDVPQAARDALAEYVTIIDHEVHRCKRIVNGLLDFSRSRDSGKSSLDVNQVVDETLFLLGHHARFKQLRVETSFGDAPLEVRGAREQLIQVLMALLLNACDAMNGTGSVRIATERRPGWAALEVTDEGVGIPLAERTRIFDPFYTTKPHGKGTGLGLSICYGIILEHGGRIEVESEESVGSTFRILLPTGGST